MEHINRKIRNSLGRLAVINNNIKFDSKCDNLSFMMSDSLPTEFAVMAYLEEEQILKDIVSNMKQRNSPEVPNGNSKTVNVHNNNNNNNNNKYSNIFRKDHIAYFRIVFARSIDKPPKLTVTPYLLLLTYTAVTYTDF